MLQSTMKNWIQMVVDKIGATYNDSEAVNVFYISAYFTEDENICKHMFLGLYPDTEQVHKIIRLLHKFKLVKPTDGSMFFIRASIQTQVRNLLKEQNKEITILTVALGLVNYLLTCSPSCASCLNHAMSVLKHVSHNTELVNSSIGLPGQIAMRLQTENNLNEATSFCDSIISILNDSVEESHKATLSLQYDLSALLVLQGKHTETIAILQSLHEKNLEHSEKDETTLILTTAAKELHNSSKYDEALQLYQAIFGAKKVSEITSKTVLIALKNYAFLLKDLERHTEAVQVLKKIIQHGRKTSKLNTDEILKMKKDIAHIHMEQKEFSSALEHFRDVFHGLKIKLGENNPDTQNAKQDIGIVLKCKGQYNEASKIFESVVNTFSQIHDEFHTNILNAQINLAGALEELGDYNTAIKITEDLYRKFKTKYGEMHKETLQKRFNIGLILKKQGQLHDAKSIFLEILEGFLIVSGLTDDLTTKVKIELKALRTLLPKHTATKYLEVLNDDESAIISFIESEACVKEEDTEGRTLLHHVTKNGYITAVEKLLEKGAMYNHEELSGKTPAQLAPNNEVKNLFILIENLFQDVKNGNCEKIADFSFRNEMINVKDEDGYSLLHWAVYKCYTPIVKILLDNGADVRSVSNLGNTVLHIASSVGNKEIIEILLQHVDKDEIKELIDSKTAILGNTALHFAAANGYQEIIISLLKHGASFNISNKKGKKPVDISDVQPYSLCVLYLNQIQEFLRHQ